MTDPLLSRTSFIPLKHALRALCILSIAAPFLSLAQTGPSQNVPETEQTTGKTVITGQEIKDIITRAVEKQKRASLLASGGPHETTVSVNTQVHDDTTYTTIFYIMANPKTGMSGLILNNTHDAVGVLLMSVAGAIDHDTDKRAYETLIELYGPDGKTVLTRTIAAGEPKNAQYGTKLLKSVYFNHVSKDWASSMMTFSHKGDEIASWSVDCIKNDGTSVKLDIPSKTSPEFTVSYRDAHHALLKTVSYERDPGSTDKAHPSYRLATRDEKTHKTDYKPAPGKVSASSYLPEGVPINDVEAGKLGRKLYNDAVAASIVKSKLRLEAWDKKYRRHP